jgi:hypothetical protein
MSFLDNIFGNGKITFHYPYSTDPNVKREQIWDNLQKGILLEDTNVFIPWATKYKNIGKFAEKRIDANDRTVWYLGKQKILDSLMCHIQVLKWLPQPYSSTFDQFSEDLGHDEEGNEGFLNCIKHFTNLFGRPYKSELEKFGSLDIGEVVWINDKVRISVVGVTIFSCRYHLYIGLIDNSHDRDQKRGMDELRAQGWTEEDFAK